MSRPVDRRFVLTAPAGIALGVATARAQAARAFTLTTSDGLDIRNFAIPRALAPSDLPGVIVTGAAKSAPILYEFFDYACPFCKLASQELDLLLGADSGLRVGLLHHPVLGAASEEAARAVLAAKTLFGDEQALRLHAGLFEQPGRIGADKARDVAAALGLDAARLQAESARGPTRAMLDAQARRALALGLKQTPSFVLGGYAFVGWPGPETILSFVAAQRRCGGLACAEAAR